MNEDLIAAGLLESWGKSAAILVVGFFLVGSTGRFSPAFRHRLWMFVMMALIAIPLLLALSPRWEVIPAWWKAPAPAPAALDSSQNPHLSSAVSETAVVAASPQSAWSGITWQAALVAIWGTGALWLLTRSILGGIWLARLCRRADSDEYPDEFQDRIDRIFQKRNSERKAELVVSEEISAPFTWGWLRPRIGLPRAALSWPEADLEMVLLHEWEHVRRRDALAMLISRMVLILNWLNPLAWLALRHAESCREAACDTRVLAAGHGSTNYAELLFQQARSVPAPVRSWATAVAETGTLERRVKMILNTDPQNASHNSTRTLNWLIGLPLLVLGVLIAIIGLAEPGIAQEKKLEIPGLDRAEAAQQKKDDGTVYRILVQPDGKNGVTLELDGKPVDRKELSQRLSKKVESPSVLLRVHEMTSAGEVTGIVDLVAKAGITKIKFASFNEPLDSQAASDNALTKKLKSVVIPSVEFSETPFVDALEFLSARSVDLSPDKKRVNIIIEGREKLEPIRISLNLNDVPLAEALYFTAELASANLKVEEHAVVISPRKATDAGQPSPLADRKADAEVAEKLRSIIVPKIEFVDTPITDALAFLRDKAGELDAQSPPEKRGINIVIHVPEDYPGDFKQVKLTLKLEQVPLAEALKYTTSLVGLKYRVSNGAVLIGAE